jgi:hypothetical protein
MKIAAIVVLVLSLGFSACDRSPRTTSAAPERTLAAERDAYQDMVRARLAEFDHRFDGLEARMKGLAPSEQEHLKIDIAELRDRRDALERKYDDMKKVSLESWRDLKASTDRSMDQLELAYNVVAANNHGATHSPLQFDDDPYYRKR